MYVTRAVWKCLLHKHGHGKLRTLPIWFFFSESLRPRNRSVTANRIVPVIELNVIPIALAYGLTCQREEPG